MKVNNSWHAVPWRKTWASIGLASNSIVYVEPEGTGQLWASASSARTILINFLLDRFWIFLIKKEIKCVYVRKRETGQSWRNHNLWLQCKFTFFSAPAWKVPWEGSMPASWHWVLRFKQLHSNVSPFMLSLTSTTETKKPLLEGSKGDFQLTGAAAGKRTVGGSCTLGSLICRGSCTQLLPGSGKHAPLVLVAILYPFLLLIWVVGLYMAGEYQKRTFNTSDKTVVVSKQFLLCFNFFISLYS